MPAQRATDPAPAPSPALILVVDDDADKRLAIRAILEPLGHAITEVPSGEEALHAVGKQTYAVILMDVKMRVMDGYETARLIRLRSQSARTPIIFVTAFPPDAAQVRIAYDAGAADFVFNPIDPVTLRSKVLIFVDMFLRSRELERSLREVTDLGARFRDSEARTRSVLDNVAEGIITLSDKDVIETFNRAASTLFGYPEPEAVGQPFSILLTAPSARNEAPDVSGDDQGEAGRETCPAELVGRRRDGSTFPLELAMSDVELGARRVQIGCVRDISERQSYNHLLEYQALHDALTTLPNRVLFADRVDHAIRAATRHGGALALLVMDLDGFKTVNDTLGHQHGDVLLQRVAQRLVDTLREEDTVARLGGDEFGILLPSEPDLSGAAAVAWKITQALEPAFQVDEHSVNVGASIGIALIPEHGADIEDLLRRADLAMYHAKRSGQDYAVFAQAQEEGPARRLALLSSLRHCVSNEELVLHYQPKIDLAAGTTIGVEALLRWNHPSGTLLMPDAFMPEVERSELMIPITEWVIHEALRNLRIWRDAGHELTMAVNLGARCVAQGYTVFEAVDAFTKTWDIPSGAVTLELTESALIDTAAPGLWERLQATGQRLSIDDFGTGYSSLAYLHRLPVFEIKADKSFVMTMASVKGDSVIVRSIIELAHNLGMQVVAEGVEDEATMKLLMAYGCDAAQGYYFSRPLPADDLLRWLATSRFGIASVKRSAVAAAAVAAQSLA